MTEIVRGARPRLVVAAGIGLLGLALVTGCTSGAAGSTKPTWVPQQEYRGQNEPQPSLPGQAVPAPTPSNPGQSSGAPPSTSPSPGQSSSATDPSVVATKLNQPTGLVVLPDGTALVGERTTGRILRVQPQPNKPVQLVQTLAGVDGSGDGGLLDLALSPSFDEDGLVYAYLTTKTDNRVVHFAVGGAPTPVLTGIPRGRTGNVGRIAFDATGALLTGTGDAGTPASAASKTSLAGKILRTDDIGRPRSDNPDPASRIYATGLANVAGLCVDSDSGSRLAVSAGSTGTPDEVNFLRRGGYYGWPNPTAGAVSPAATLPAASAGGAGCAVVNGRVVIATTTTKSLVAATLDSSGRVGTFSPVVQGKYGRLRTVVAGGDGALWLTTSNRDGLGKPVPDDDRVIRISAAAAGGGDSQL